MYKKLSLFKQPPGKSIIWRYLSFTKFISMLENQSLFFCRADLLEDQHEGTLPPASVQLRRENYNNGLTGAGAGTIIDTGRISNLPKKLDRDESLRNEEYKKNIYLNGWYMNKHESYAMWKVYLNNLEGVAVQSTVNSLRDCIIDEIDVYIARVTYINFNDEKIPLSEDFDLHYYSYKSIHYDYEKELRAISGPLDKWSISQSKDTPSGIHILIDPKILIHRIYVPPSSPKWFKELVEKTLQNHRLKVLVYNSQLDEQGLF